MAQRKVPSGPQYPLKEVLDKLPTAIVDDFRGIRIVSALVEEAGGTLAAKRYVREIVAALRPEDFAHTKVMSNWVPPATVDVYGSTYKERNWYVKLRINGGNLYIISCHPPEEDLHLRSGGVLKADR
jgi:hypothetical protein